jgi:hypothetical protein
VRSRRAIDGGGKAQVGTGVATMTAVHNHTKERLEAGEVVLGVGLRQARTVDIGRIMKTAGYDFLFIDMEHNSIAWPGFLPAAARHVAFVLQIRASSPAANRS